MMPNCPPFYDVLFIIQEPFSFCRHVFVIYDIDIYMCYCLWHHLIGLVFSLNLYDAMYLLVLYLFYTKVRLNMFHCSHCPMLGRIYVSRHSTVYFSTSFLGYTSLQFSAFFTLSRVILILPPTSLSLVRPFGSHRGWVKLQPFIMYIYFMLVEYVWFAPIYTRFYYICDFG